MTKDSVTVFVNAIMYYKVGFLQIVNILLVNINIVYQKVSDSNKAVGNVDDYNTSTRSLAAATLRNILGTRN